MDIVTRMFSSYGGSAGHVSGGNNANLATNCVVQHKRHIYVVISVPYVIYK